MNTAVTDTEVAEPAHMSGTSLPGSPERDSAAETARAAPAASVTTSTTATEPTAIEPNGKKRKREKYAAKACEACKRRKIKCGGGYPCGPCIRRKRRCISTDEEACAEDDGSGPRWLDQGGSTKADSSNDELRTRLAALESQLTRLTEALQSRVPSPSQWRQHDRDEELSDKISEPVDNEGNQEDHATEDNRSYKGSSTESPKDPSRLSFTSSKRSCSTRRTAGDTSVMNVLQRVEDQLSELGLPIVERVSSAPATPPMTPLPRESYDGKDELPGHKIGRALRTNGIKPDRKIWDDYLSAYLLEIHPLYPFLHEPSITEMYYQLWDTISPSAETSEHVPQQLDNSIHVILILANGCCALSNRVDTGDGLHSAGWSLYCAAKDLQGPLVDTVCDDSRPLQSLHSLTLIVVYLLRLEANELAQKVLSLAITHAHHLGLNQERTLDDMPEFEKDMYRRVWWCIYVLDRRLSLLLGRPFLIQDMNVSVNLPQTQRHGVSPSSTCGSSGSSPTAIIGTSNMEYLVAMVGFSRVVGKVWEELYSAQAPNKNSHLYDYLEGLVENWHASVPASLICDAEKLHDSARADGATLNFKQRFLVKARYLCIRILIRGPMRRMQTDFALEDGILSASMCIQDAKTIVGMSAQCSPSDGVYGFPFLAYLLEATITILACLSKLPHLKERYRSIVESALKMLNQWFKKTWVSGKTARMIYKLNYLIPRLFMPTQTSAPQTVLKPLVEPSYTINQSSHHNNFYHHGSISTNSLQPLNYTMTALPAGSPTWLALDTTNRSDAEAASSNTTQTAMGSLQIDPPSNGASDDMFGNFQSSMIEDFPFELQLGNSAAQVLAQPYTAYTAPQDESMCQWIGNNNVDWLDKLVLQDTWFPALP
ncbi:hypothetical protein VF21_04902 [Pseudogymnoascus sp. 05NY08]|nr:hypothetical protein VF21_04902 [Pseudogymnoascus sp. 05NY08]